MKTLIEYIVVGILLLLFILSAVTLLLLNTGDLIVLIGIKVFSIAGVLTSYKVLDILGVFKKLSDL